MNLDTLLVIYGVVFLVICNCVMWYCSKNVYLKYNKTGNACPHKKATR